MLPNARSGGRVTMETKHTPGPWNWTDAYTTGDDQRTWSLIGADGYGILSCDGVANSPQGQGDLGEINALLIAASPTLYAYTARMAEAGDSEAAAILEEINACR